MSRTCRAIPARCGPTSCRRADAVRRGYASHTARATEGHAVALCSKSADARSHCARARSRPRPGTYLRPRFVADGWVQDVHVPLPRLLRAAARNVSRRCRPIHFVARCALANEVTEALVLRLGPPALRSRMKRRTKHVQSLYCFLSGWGGETVRSHSQSHTESRGTLS
jgi:hypothetical protein